MRNNIAESSVKLGIGPDTFFGATDVRSNDIMDIEMLGIDVEGDLMNPDFLHNHMPDLNFDLFHELQLPNNSLLQDFAPNNLICDDSNNSDGSQTSASEFSYFDPFSAEFSSPSPTSSTGPISPVNVTITFEPTNQTNPEVSPDTISTTIQTSHHQQRTPSSYTSQNLRKSRGRCSSSNEPPDVQALRRQIRMIRNRESACLSRQKKKDYVSRLEAEVKELELENVRLRQENSLLKARLSAAVPTGSSEVPKPISVKLPISTSAVKWQKDANRGSKNVVGKVILLTLCTSVFLFMRHPSISESNPNIARNSSGKLGLSRTLDTPTPFRPRWADGQARSVNGSTSKVATSPNLFPIPIGPKSTNHNASNHLCPLHFNQTDALRVQNDLEGLFKGKPKKLRMAKPIVYHLSQLDFLQDENKGLTVYDKQQGKYSGLLEKLERRQDTFYVLSLTVENQVLLSAQAHNVSSRPKMSFLMPWRNETLDGKEELMQIDCEVTRVLNLDRGKRKRRNTRK